MARSTACVAAVLAAIVVALGLIVQQVGVPMAVGLLGYTSKVACSAVFVHGRTLQSVLDGELGHPPFTAATLTVDEKSMRLHATLLGLSRTAQFVERFGCHLVAAAGDNLNVAPSVLPPLPPTPTGFWPATEERDPVAVAAALADVDVAALNAAVSRGFADPSPAQRLHTRAVVVVHKGQVVAEQYAEGYHPTQRHTGWSMSKSVLATLIASRISEGKLSLNDTALFPEWSDVTDPRRAITLDSLLRMEDGLDFGEVYSKHKVSDVTRMLFIEDSTAAFAIQKPLGFAPSSRFYYSSGSTNLMSYLLRRTFESDEAYWQYPFVKLFYPLGIRSAVFETDSNGTFVGSSFCHMSARDWARFGLLYLQNGQWNGQQVLPEWWVAHATRASPASLAVHDAYGTQWWLNTPAIPSNSTSQRYPSLPADLYLAHGFEHQFVIVVPSHDLVVVRLGFVANEAWWTDEEAWIKAILDSVTPASP